MYIYIYICICIHDCTCKQRIGVCAQQDEPKPVAAILATQGPSSGVQGCGVWGCGVW